MDHSKTAAIYTRISRDPEGTRVGVDAQAESCRKLIASLGLVEVAYFEDNDVPASAQSKKRKPRLDYPRLLEGAKAGRFSHVVAYSTSRLTRRPRELEDLIDLAEEAGTQFHTVVQKIDLSTPSGRFVARIFAGMDAQEAAQIAERQEHTFSHNANEGKVRRTHQRPFGYLDDHVTIEPREAALIRAAVTDIKAGASITSIARQWEKQGIRTSTGGEKWTWSVLHRVLLGWRTAGVRTYRRKPVEVDGRYVMGQWDPIITLEEREQALAMLAKRGLTKTRQAKWLLSGLVRCGECQGPMYGQLKHGKAPSTYGCKDGNSHVAITADKLEWWVLIQLYHRLYDRNRAATAPKQKAPSVWPDQAILTDTQDRIDDLRRRWSDRTIDDDTFYDLNDELRRERRRLLDARDRFSADRAEQPLPDGHWLTPFLDASEQVLSAPFEQKEVLLRREVKRIKVAKGERGHAAKGTAYQSRITIEWRDDE